MPRRYIAAFLATLIFAVLSLHASDFWISKDWKQWSRDDCERMLAESPWAHSWRGGGSYGEQLGPGSGGQPLGGGPDREALVYSVQLRSALPIREAIVRKLQFDQKYDKMTEVQKKSFDTQAEQILTRTYDNMILVHVDFSKGSAANELNGHFGDFMKKGIEQLNASLICDDGSQLNSSRFEMKALGSFDLIFPRVSNGAPAIQEGQKHFSVQFQSPLIQFGSNTTVPSKRVRVDFDLEKMSFGGKLSY